MHELTVASAKTSLNSIAMGTLDYLESQPEDIGPLGFCEGASLAFTDIRYKVPALKGGKINILKSVTGQCRSGRLLALMGASGAGKTSLIDILAGHVRSGVSGQITLNGAPFKAADFQKRSCYVLQRDILLATATVKEAITTSALLRLPQHMSRKEKRQRVLDVLQQLELENCAKTLVGDDAQGIKGISGGERRRLSVAIGLVTDPQIILLDEPTSGLDSETACQLINCLTKLARANRTVVASIHQPNSQITDCFDDLLLLAGGRSVYFGTWEESVSYFASVGYKCPLYTNPSDFYLNITKDAGQALAKKWDDLTRSWSIEDWNSPHGIKGGFSSSPGDHKLERSSEVWSPIHQKSARRSLTFSGEDDFIKVGVTPRKPSSTSTSPTHPVTPEFSGCAAGLPCSPVCPASPGAASLMSMAGSSKEPVVSPQPATNWLFQMRVLFVRFVRTWYRTPHLLISFLAQYIFAGIFMGLMYVQLGTTRSSSIFDRQASLFLVLVMLAFTPSNTACTVWESERLLLRREANSGAYKLSTFFAAKTLVTFPMQAFVALIYCILMYYITGYQTVASKFIIFLVVCIVFQLISETLGSICAIITRTATMGILLSSTLLMVLVAFSGFLINNTPVFFRWISKMSFVSFAYSALYQNEFNGLRTNFTAPNSLHTQATGLELTLGSSDFICTPSGVHSASRGPNGINFTISQNIAILCGILVGLRFVMYVLLQLAYKLKKL